MNFRRILALLYRYLYLYKRSLPRLLDIFYWPTMSIFVWGFLSSYFSKSGFSPVNLVTVLLGALIFWELIYRSQLGVTLTFLEEIWQRNLLNIFVTPVKISEIIASSGLLAMIRILVVVSFMSILAYLFYSFNIFNFGFSLIPFFINILIFGFVFGLFTSALILRYGQSAEVLAFGLVFSLQPLSCVFYPLSALPSWLQPVSKALPSTWVFEGMRQVISRGVFPASNLLWAVGLNLIYLILVLWFFSSIFAKVKNKGLLLKADQ